MTTRKRKASHDDDSEFAWSWRSLALIVYLVICCTDFILMPVYYEWSNSKYHPAKMIALAKTMPEAQQLQALEVLRSNRKWEPITNEMFHIAFGGLLTAAAWQGRNGQSTSLRWRRKQTDGDEVEGSYGFPQQETYSYGNYNQYGQQYNAAYQQPNNSAPQGDPNDPGNTPVNFGPESNSPPPTEAP